MRPLQLSRSIHPVRGAGVALALSLLAAAGTLGSCDANGGPTGQAVAKLSVESQSLLELASEAHLNYAFDAVRRVEFYTPGKLPVAHRERLRVDDEGQSRLEVTEVITAGTLDPTTYVLLQTPRTGYYTSYRDARIRDLDLLGANYLVEEQLGTVQVAGRECSQLEFLPRFGPNHMVRLAIDVETGVTLSVTEFDASGQASSQVVVESIEYGAPAAFVPDEKKNNEQVLDAAAVSAAIGIELQDPVLLPDGFALSVRSTVEVLEDEVWAKSTYTDGLDVLFYLQRPAQLEVQMANPLRPGAPKVGGPIGQDKTPGDDRTTGKPFVWKTYELGAIKVMWGQVGDRQRIAMGRVSMDSLQRMLESAF